MISKEIHCTFCGLKGEIGNPENEAGRPGKKVFRHLGHNPFSGHLHYQCPFCAIILLALPMDILEGKPLQGIPGPQPQARPLREAFRSMLNPFRAIGKIFPHPWIHAGGGMPGMRRPDVPLDRGGL